MSFVLGLSNKITGVVSPTLAYAEGVARLNNASSNAGVDSLPASQQISLLDNSFESRFSQDPVASKSVHVAQNIERRIPGDRVSAALPIPASVSWQFTQVSAGPSTTWERAGQGRVLYSDFVAQWIIVPGAHVQFKDQLPGREDLWYEVVSIKPKRASLAGTPGTIAFDLREVLHGSSAGDTDG